MKLNISKCKIVSFGRHIDKNYVYYVGRLVVHGPVITRPRVLSPTLYVPEATTTRVD